MLHHGRQRHLERLREFADGQVRMRGQACKERAPRWVSQRREGAIQCVCLKRVFPKLNHEVNYRDSSHDVKPLFEVFLGETFMNPAHRSLPIPPSSHKQTQPLTLALPAHDRGPDPELEMT